MTDLELILTWVAIGAYALASAAMIPAFILDKPRLLRVGMTLVVVGAVAQFAALVSRSIRSGHLPMLGFFEVASGLVFVMVVGYLLLSWRYHGLTIAGAAIMPVAFMLLGATLLVDPAVQEISGSLASIWLAVHVLFANLAYGFYAAAFVMASAYLMRQSRYAERWKTWLDRLPPQEVLDELQFKIVGAGFLFQGIMIATGAIWANEAWGRYWGWDAMEIWSLIAWGVYALYLHLTLTMGWRGNRAAWVLVIALPVIAFSLLGVPVVYDSIHGAYLSL